VKVEKVIVLEKLWGNEEALERHFQSENYRKVLVVVSLDAMLTEHL
jgi:quinol monooxygenase YgiN